MSMEDRVRELAEEVEGSDATAMEDARARHLTLAKPPGSLGRLEELGARLDAMAGENVRRRCQRALLWWWPPGITGCWNGASRRGRRRSQP